MAPSVARRPGLRVHVEEDHHWVLNHIFRAIGAKHLPFHGHVLLHFDSHPDLLLPRDLTGEQCLDKAQLLDAVSIENWILPCAFMGIINRIVWVRPPWARQIPSGQYRFHVGRDNRSGRLRCTCLASYFLSEAVVARLEDLDEAQPVDLLVVELNGREERQVMDFVGPADETSLLLDVDLDFFSTANPFLALHDRAQLYSRLQRLYHFEAVPPSVEGPERLRLALESSQRRDRLLDHLGQLFDHLQAHRTLDQFQGPATVYLDDVKDIYDRVTEFYPDHEIDWALVHTAGCTCDDTELPHHISSTEEIEGLLTRMEALLAGLPHPTKITVARSTEDEFCPPSQVEGIQTQFLELVTRLYPEAQVLRHYEEEELD